MRIMLVDGGRHRIYSGYGYVAQCFALALYRHPKIQLQILDHPKKWEYDGIYKDELMSINVSKNIDSCDLILQIGNPSSYKKFQKPSVFFTLCDQSDLSSKNSAILKECDAIITASKSGFKVFNKYVPKVYITPLPGDPKVFKPVPRWRPEGYSRFSFIFIGSFSFRKGIDLLIEAFLQEFSWEEVNLHLHCPSDQAKSDQLANFILNKCQEYKKPPMFSLSTQFLHPQWVNRYYNRADAFVSFTRGEGWGLPIAEAMLCELPVIAPLSTSMLDYLTNDVAFCLPTQEKLVADISDDFGINYKNTHGGSYYEIDLEVAKKTLRYVWENQKNSSEIGKKGKEHIINNYSFEKFSNAVYEAIFDFMNS